jgi:hypothetical protein
MAALSATFPWGRTNFFAFFQNFADEDGRSLGESPEQRQRVKLSPQVVIPPTNLQNPFSVGDHVPGWGRKGTADSIEATRTEFLPIAVNLAFAKTQVRGQRNIPLGRTATGRWENLGQAPADGCAIGFDYWERILIDPSVVDLGNVVSDTQITTTIRNTFRRDTKSITAIDNNAGAGITVTGATPPASIAPLFDKIYIVTVTTQGPPNIEGTIDWTTSTGILTLALSGTRIIIFQWPPQSSIEEELAWLTDLIKSADGSEQRFSLRVNPRQSVSYEIMATNQKDVNQIRNLMIDWTTRVFGVPIWWNEINLTTDVAINDLTINVRAGALDTRDYRAGSLAMVYQENADGSRTFDVLQIASVRTSIASPESTANQITFVTAILNAYDGDLATVVPVLPGILTKGVNVDSSRVGDLSTYSAKFNIIDNLANVRGVEPQDYPELDDFDGAPAIVIDDINYLRGNTLAEEFTQKGQRVDFKTGTFFQLTQETRARRSTPFRWVIEDSVYHSQIRALLYYLRGKWKSAWVPTWRHDFAVNSNIGAGANTIDVENDGFSLYVAGGTPWAGIRLLQTNGTISYHRITTSVEIDTTTERLTIDPVTPNAITIAEVERMELMILARQTDDKVTLLHNWMDAESDAVDITIDSQFIGDLQ